MSKTHRVVVATVDTQNPSRVKGITRMSGVTYREACLRAQAMVAGALRDSNYDVFWHDGDERVPYVYNRSTRQLVRITVEEIAPTVPRVETVSRLSSLLHKGS